MKFKKLHMYRLYSLFVLSIISVSTHVYGTEPIQATYAFAVGDQANIMPSGTIWLYHYSWYGLKKFRLAEIVNGQTSISLSQERLRQDIQPHQNTDAYLLVLEFPPSQWYRTPDIPAHEIFQTLFPVLETLGHVAYRSDGVKLLVLPAPVEHRIVLKNQDGLPIVDADIPVSMYVYDHNHCGAHFGIGLGTFTTNMHGEIRFFAPVVPLHLNIFYYEPAGQGLAGEKYVSHRGLNIPKDIEQTLQIGWKFPVEPFVLHVQHHDGTPVPNLMLVHCLLSAECGVHCGSLWNTDDAGNVYAEFAPQTIQSLSFRSKAGEEYALNDEELTTLLTKKSLTVIWDK